MQLRVVLERIICVAGCNLYVKAFTVLLMSIVVTVKVSQLSSVKHE